MPGKANKTQKSQQSVDDFLSAVAPDTKRSDSLALVAMMQRLSGVPAMLWGPSIVGFGLRRYKYDSGREGETPLIGFAPRKEALVLYGLGVQGNPLIEGLGKFTTGKGCLYIKRLSDIDGSVLEAMISLAVQKDDVGRE